MASNTERATNVEAQLDAQTTGFSRNSLLRRTGRDQERAQKWPTTASHQIEVANWGHLRQLEDAPPHRTFAQKPVTRNLHDHRANSLSYFRAPRGHTWLLLPRVRQGFNPSTSVVANRRVHGETSRTVRCVRTLHIH